ncbi:DUF6476 family protein [Paracoccus sp. Ld10]|uniref:DUF6476 family protein n=1 Tax=Paracoccus sp. Ld10 TaxID=649158 RepID=UPI00386AC0F3
MAQDDTDWKVAAKAVPELRFLKTLVTGLTLVMGVGIIAVVVLLWVRLNQPALPELPDTITLPQNTQTRAVTFGTDRIIVLTMDDRILVYDRAGVLVGQTVIQP